MKKIIDFIANETDGKNYKSYKYCFESIEVPKISYDDKKGIKAKRSGETDKSLKKSKSLKALAEKMSKSSPLFNFFLDGSRRTYKIDDIAYGGKLYPIIAGQIGVAICERSGMDTFKPTFYQRPIVISIPNIANASTSARNENLFFKNLGDKVNELSFTKSRNVEVEAIIPYSSAKLKDSDKYEDRGVAKIQDRMIEMEQNLVLKLVKAGKLNEDSFLMKDGSLEYMKSGEGKELSSIKANYDCVVGVSKAFNPESLSNDVKDISRIIAELKEFHRTPAFMYETERIPDVKFAVWYLRLRNTISPFEGVVKVEKILVRDQQELQGLDSDEIDIISASILNERNPVCYGKDSRWAKHLYPVHLTESYIKSMYLSDIHFINLF